MLSNTVGIQIQSSCRPRFGPTALGNRRQELSGRVSELASVVASGVRACVLCVGCGCVCVCVCMVGVVVEVAGEVGGHTHTLPLNSRLRLPSAVGPNLGQLLLINMAYA